jgi:hypothetical protein
MTPIASEHPSPGEPDALTGLAARAAAHLRLTGTPFTRMPSTLSPHRRREYRGSRQRRCWTRFPQRTGCGRNWTRARSGERCGTPLSPPPRSPHKRAIGSPCQAAEPATDQMQGYALSYHVEQMRLMGFADGAVSLWSYNRRGEALDEARAEIKRLTAALAAKPEAAPPAAMAHDPREPRHPDGSIDLSRLGQGTAPPVAAEPRGWRIEEGTFISSPGEGCRVDATPPQAQPAQASEPTPEDSFVAEIRALCAQTLKVPPGTSVPIPPSIRAEIDKFMRDQPSAFDRIAWGEFKNLAALAHHPKGEA